LRRSSASRSSKATASPKARAPRRSTPFYRDEDGFFFLVDRTKDMIIRGGENNYPREIEDVLLEFVGVEGAAVIGRPHEVRSEEVHAVLVLAPGVELVRIEEHAERDLRSSRCRVRGRSSTSCPKTATGKIVKKPLRERVRSRSGA
jgi:acyl-CoA synthetase (AMP-forming)/AMP-acid ligase II